MQQNKFTEGQRVLVTFENGTSKEGVVRVVNTATLGVALDVIPSKYLVIRKRKCQPIPPTEKTL